MKRTTLITATLFALFCSKATASNIHSFDELRDSDSQPSQPLYFKLVPVDAKEISKEATKSSLEEQKQFTGKGHRVGGDPYVNRLLGIDHEEGKRLHKLAKKAAKQEARKKRKKTLPKTLAEAA